GRHHHYEGVSLAVRPQQDPLEIWLGGRVPAALRRCGRVGEGWMPGRCTAAEAAAARTVIEAGASEHGRTIDPEHFGVLVPYTHGELNPQTREILTRRAPDVDPNDIVPTGWDGLRTQLERFIEVGASKFVPILVGEPDDWTAELTGVGDAVLDLTT
ncbi:MAG: LLM class flavin-dependent oxidoreductase, partial [Actinomycetia bacterium]|nr:LLM class flavin-dependent oxidoreductase [Actinomycetes bacterium]